jgi:sporulation protein YlmC with PRC-barrel domain
MIARFSLLAGIGWLMVTPALAQDAAPVDFATESRITADGYQAQEGDKLLSRVYFANVYASADTSAPIIGTITDIVVNETGDITAMIVGVGGFLHIGEKAIALDYTDLQWTTATDGSWRWVLPTTTAALMGAPAFTWQDQGPSSGIQTFGIDATPAAVAEELGPNFGAGLLTARQLLGAAVWGATNEQIGTINDLVLGGDAQGVDAVVVDVGGFLGMGAKPVAIAIESLVIPANAVEAHAYIVNATAEMLTAQPAYDAASYVREREAQRLVLVN